MKFKYRKKTFLSKEVGDLSSILLEAEDSEQGKKKSGQYTVSITDNHNRVTLDFYLGTKKHRKQSLSKINLLITELVRFGHTLMEEAQAMEKGKKDAS